MLAVTFIKLVEQGYQDLENQCRILKSKHGFELFEKPEYICERVQKFRSWFTMAVRSTEISGRNSPVSPEEVLIEASEARCPVYPDFPRHQKVIDALRLFEKTDLEGLLGETRVLSLEQAMGSKLDNCKFKVCYDHCTFVQGAESTKPKLKGEGDSTPSL